MSRPASPLAIGSQAHAQVVAAANALTANWARQTFTGQSIVISGAGLHPLLAILAASAKGPSQKELEAAVGLPSDAGFAAAATILSLLHDSPSIQAALGVWTQKNLNIRSSWRDSLPQASWGQFRGDTSDAQGFDKWASTQTHGQIARFPLTISPSSLLVLASALLVQTQWLQPFQISPSPLRTISGPWTRSDLACLNRRSTALDDLLLAPSTPIGPLTLLEVLGDGDISVYLILANEDAIPGAVIAQALFQFADVRALQTGSALLEGDTAPGVSVHLVPSTAPSPILDLQTVPFKIISTHDLLRQKSLFGLAHASDASSGHFPQISGTPLFVSAAVQAATATFSDKGFIASTITAIEMTLGSAMPQMPAGRQLEIRVRFDRPFGFVAVHRPTHLALICGWVEQPQTFHHAR